MTKVEVTYNKDKLNPVVDAEKENSQTLWCPKKECYIHRKICNACPDNASCHEYAKFSGKLSEENRRKRAVALDQEIESLKTSIFDSYYVLGEMLREIREGIYYKELGYQSLDEYAEKRHGFRYRKAAYLIAIVENCEAADLTKEDVRGIEWSKMKELPELTEENRAEWLKKATEMSVEDLKNEVKKSKGEESKEKKIFMSFSFDVSQKEIVDRALDLAAKLTGSDVRSYHLQVLAEEFISTYGTMDEASISRFNDMYGDE
jgi:predicted HicB family RNase H-like nuclease